MTNKQVIENFTQGIASKNENLFSEKDNYGRLVLYSYGYHFPMALRLEDGYYWVNNSYYSQTTSRHQSILKHLIRFAEVGFTNTEGLKEDIINKNFNSQLEKTEQEI